MGSNKTQQKRRQRDAARKKQRRTALIRTRQAAGDLANLGSWPVVHAHINTNWRSDQSLAITSIARRNPAGGLTAAVFLVDHQCLGIKNVIWRPRLSLERYEEMLDRIAGDGPVERCSPELVAKVVDEGVRYAESLGFTTPADASKARRILEGIDPGSCTEDVPLGGTEGKPLYVAGPDDDVDAIMRQLQRRLGHDGFHFIAPLDVL